MNKDNSPSSNDSDDEFWDLTDKFITLANECGTEAELGKVGAAMLYAASRFNTFVVASSSVDKAEFVADMDEVMDYFTKQFRHMLGGNLRDFRDNYKIYMQTDTADKT